MPLGVPPDIHAKRAAELVRTTCPYCGVGCGIDAVREDPGQGMRLVSVSGTPEHPANFGRLCIKGTHLPQTNGESGRMLFPTVSGQRVEWDVAINKVAAAFREAIDQHGPDSVALYVSGQLLTEDYYVANKLMKGYVGSANIDTNSRLCMSSAVAGHKRAFGADAVPVCYDDIEQAELVVLVGSNAAWTHPVLFQRLERAKQLNPHLKIVVIDPRKTETCSIADLHLALRGGSDVALFNGLLRYLDNQDGFDKSFVDAHTDGFGEAIKAARDWSETEVAIACGLDESTVKLFYQWFTSTEKTMTWFCMGVNQSVQGVDKVNSIINAHLASGKIGKPGTGPFSLTGQPNAMGGREVGGLANMLAAHMDIDNPAHRDRVQRFWQSPNMAEQPGLKALDLFDKAAAGEIKVLWIMATNPLVSMPDSALVERALKACPTVIVSDCVAQNDTLQLADIALPAAGWSEKDGTVTNSERCVSRQRGLQLPVGEARPDWQIICDVAKRLDFEGFNYAHPYQIFNEHAALSGFENQGERAFDISGLSGMTRLDYDALQPIQWPVNSAHPQGCKRLFTDGRFFTPSGLARFVPVQPVKPAQAVSKDYPFVLNTGRLRDQWHTMTRTGKADVLLAHTPQSLLHIHPLDAQKLAVEEGQMVQVCHQQAPDNLLILPAHLTTTVAERSVFAPIHWNRQNTTSGIVNVALQAVGDPISGQPELKHGAVRVEALSTQSYWRVFSNRNIPLRQLAENFAYAVVRQASKGWLYVLADEVGLSPGLSRLQEIFAQPENGWIGCTEQEQVRMLGCENMQMNVAIWGQNQPFSANSETPWLDDITSSVNQPLDKASLSALLNGQALSDGGGKEVVCQCHQVTRDVIEDRIISGQRTLRALGQSLKCGTGCGSCRSELRAMLDQIPEVKEALS